jgi:UDP-2,4-diacetamido-2,4,6-trideoxy-beta-L-altropyranose hydrolase
LAIFRTDASVAIGGGHVMRCLTLARALADEGWHCGFARRRDTLAQMSFPEVAEFDFLALDAGDDGHDALRRRWPGGADILVVDHYDLDADFERGCRDWAGRILVIDDLANRPHDADILLDQTCGRLTQDYGGLVSVHCRLLLGADYALLRPEFAARRDQALARRRSAPPARRVMVAVGSSDPMNYTAVALDAAVHSGLDVGVDVILGSSAPHLTQVRKLCEELPLAVRVHVDVSAEELSILMDQADIAVGAGGIASWERCCLGLPSLVVLTAENQRLVVANLARAGAIEFLGDAPAVDAGSLAETLRNIAHDGEARCDMGRKAAEVCDGRGAERVIRALAAEDG